MRAPDAANVAAQDCGAKLREAIGGRMVYFDRSMRQVRAEGQPLIRSLAAVLRDGSKVSVVVEGHTDADGRRGRNQRLSENRAAEVVKALRAAGAPEAGLASAGFGASRPVAANANADDKAKNRRVEIVIR